MKGKKNQKNKKVDYFEQSRVLGEKEDVCGICGSVTPLDDMWVLCQTKHEAMNICLVCKNIYDVSVKDFSVLVYNNRDVIKARVGKDLMSELKKKFSMPPRMARLWHKMKKKHVETP